LRIDPNVAREKARLISRFKLKLLSNSRNAATSSSTGGSA